MGSEMCIRDRSEEGELLETTPFAGESIKSEAWAWISGDSFSLFHGGIWCLGRPPFAGRLLALGVEEIRSMVFGS